jgi:CRP-like cAMP-binding protein
VETSSLEPLLREHRFLRELSDDHVRFMAGCARNVRYAPGELLFREGDPADALLLLRSGSVVLEIDVPGRGAVRLESAGEGEMLGWSWLFPPYRHQLDARVLEPVRALAFDAGCLRRKMEENHDFGYTLAMQLLDQAHRRLGGLRLLRLDLYRTEAGAWS